MNFTVKIETIVSDYTPYINSELKVNESFDSKKDAQKFKREMIKKFELQNHGGYIVNYSSGLELFTNY